MISICIPTYNFPNYRLVNQLCDLIEKSNATIELIVIDDASDQKARFDKHKLPGKVRFIQLEENIGRAKIRNKFLDYATQDYLLFIDGDSQLLSDSFLDNYLSELNGGEAEVICGRSVYPETKPPMKNSLRWKYGKKIESKGVEERKQQPYRSFMTNNFLVKKSVFEQIKFDESLTDYGHEDTLFGFELKQKEIEVLHIDNPVLNAETETNQLYLEKSKSAINNLISIWGKQANKEEFAKHVKLLHLYSKIKPLGLAWLTSLFFQFFGKQIEKQLGEGSNKLTLFSVWKLGFLTKKLKS